MQSGVESESETTIVTRESTTPASADQREYSRKVGAKSAWGGGETGAAVRERWAAARGRDGGAGVTVVGG